MPEHPPVVRRSQEVHWRAPAAPPGLIGRDGELSALMNLVTAGAPLVTITGEGGIGKTALALALAERLRRPVAFVQLADIPPAEVADRLAAAFDQLAGASIPPATTGWPVLLLDTFDRHLSDASILTGFRLRSPQPTVLITSRGRLGLRDEIVLPLAGLATDEAGPAVQLFLSRAAAVGSRIGGQEQLAAVAAVCEFLHGVPLAVELAADRTTLMSPAALLEKLASGESLSVLGRGPADGPSRQRSMRASLSWSYQLLGAGEKTLLRRLAVFAGGSFSLTGAEQVCPDADERTGRLTRSRSSTRWARSSTCISWSPRDRAATPAPLVSGCSRPLAATPMSCSRPPARPLPCAPGLPRGAWR